MIAPKNVSFVDFCQKVIGVELTPGQRVLALVGVDKIDPASLDPADREIAEKLGINVAAPPSAQMVLCIVKGARIGGSYIFGGLYSLWRALTADLHTLAPGEVAVALIVAPDIRLARQTLRYVSGAAESVPSVARLIASKTSDSITLARPDGRKVSIECLPATRGGSAVRGRSLVSAVLSEAAFFRDEAAAVNDVDIFRAVMPRVMPGGMVVLESTPWVEAGLLYDLFTKNFAEPQDAIACQAPTLLMRPDERTRLIVENEYARDSENADREFGAKFISGGGGLFFGPDLISHALDKDLDRCTFRPQGARIALGGDIGLVSDASSWAAVSGVGSVITFLDYSEQRPKKGAPLKLSEVVQAACNFAGQYEHKRIVVDHHELEAAREHLPPGYTFHPCDGGGDAKAERYLKLREALRQGNVRVPSTLAKLTNQLSLIVAKPRPGGGTAIVLPRRAGTHMDLASAFVLAFEEALTAGHVTDWKTINNKLAHSGMNRFTTRGFG